MYAIIHKGSETSNCKQVLIQHMAMYFGVRVENVYSVIPPRDVSVLQLFFSFNRIPSEAQIRDMESVMKSLCRAESVRLVEGLPKGDLKPTAPAASKEEVLEIIRRFAVTQDNLLSYVNKIVSAIPESVREEYPEDDTQAAMQYAPVYYGTKEG